MLAYTLPELASEYRTSKDNIYILVDLGLIKTVQFSSQKLVSIREAERFLFENAGKSFRNVISEEKQRKELSKLNKNILEMKKEAQK